MKRRCPVCSSDKKTLLYVQRFGNKTISLMDEYDIVACDACGFVYGDRLPTQECFNDYYRRMSKYEFSHSGGVVPDDCKRHFEKILSFTLPFLEHKDARILDIGCSTGHLLSLFKDAGYGSVLGIDPSPACVETARKISGVEAKVDNISDYSPTTGFDLVILSAVLEHFVDLDSAMNKIGSLLEDGSLLFVEIPDASRFNSYIYTPFQQFSIEHINYFSRCSATNLLSRYGFEVLSVEENENRINQTIDPDLLIMARKSGDLEREIEKDDITAPNLRDYIVKCSKMDQEMKGRLDAVTAEREAIIIWGVGTHTQMLIGSGLDLSRVLCFVDSNVRYRGKKINGVEIKAPEDIDSDAPILISSYSYQEEIAQQIRGPLSLSNEILVLYT